MDSSQEITGIHQDPFQRPHQWAKEERNTESFREERTPKDTLRGRILRCFSDTEGEVEIPTGRYRAHFLGMKPIPNVELLFKIERTEPELWLRIAGIRSTAAVSTEHILAAFNIPQTKDHLTLTNSLRKIRHFLEKEHLEQLFSLWQTLHLQQIIPDTLTPESTVFLLLFLQEFNIPINKKLISSILPIFQHTFQDIAQLLYRFSMQIPERIRTEVAENIGDKKIAFFPAAKLLQLVSLSETEQKIGISRERTVLEQYVTAECCLNTIFLKNRYPMQWTGLAISNTFYLPIQLHFEASPKLSELSRLRIEYSSQTFPTLYIDIQQLPQSFVMKFWSEQHRTITLLQANEILLRENIQKNCGVTALIRYGSLEIPPETGGFDHLNVLI